MGQYTITAVLYSRTLGRFVHVVNNVAEFEVMMPPGALFFSLAGSRVHVAFSAMPIGTPRDLRKPPIMLRRTVGRVLAWVGTTTLQR